MFRWKNTDELTVTKVLRLAKGAVLKIVGSDGSTSSVDLTELAALDNIAAADLAKIDGITNGTGAPEKAAVLDSSGNFAMPAAGHFAFSRATIAAAGSGASDAAVLTGQMNVVTGADDAKGVALPAAAATIGPVWVVNDSSTASLLVYPVNGGNDNINALAEDAAFRVGPGKSAMFLPTSATQWYVEDQADGVEQLIIPICGNAKVGATAGWVITAGTDKMHATLPASQTGSTLVVPIDNLCVGDTVTAVSVQGQVESAGNNVTLTMDVRKQTNAAADNTDASLATDNVGTLTSDTKITSAELGVSSLTEVLATDEALYVLLTGTTAASTDIDLTHLVVTVRRKR